MWAELLFVLQGKNVHFVVPKNVPKKCNKKMFQSDVPEKCTNQMYQKIVPKKCTKKMC